MRVNERFDPDSKRIALPANLQFRPASSSDLNSIAKLIGEYDPQAPAKELLELVQQELLAVKAGKKYFLYLAVLDGDAIGFCRFYDSAGLPKVKKVYASPEGWYAMGILVSKSYRRMGIARFLSENRIRVLEKLGIKELYSIADENNLVSIKMHQQFGFKECIRARGFLNVEFNPGLAILFRKNI